MKAFFASPARAAMPVIYLSCAKAAGERTGIYLHMMREKEPSGAARDPRSGALLWSKSAAMAARHAP